MKNESFSTKGTNVVIHLILMSQKAIDEIGESKYVFKLEDGYQTSKDNVTITNSLVKANDVAANNAPKETDKYPYILYAKNAHGGSDPIIYVSWNHLTDTSSKSIDAVKAWLLGVANSYKNPDYLNEDGTKYTILKIGWNPTK